MQEKEQLLQELRNTGSAKEAEVVRCRIRQLEHDLQQHALDYSTQQTDADKSVSCFSSFELYMLIEHAFVNNYVSCVSVSFML